MATTIASPVYGYKVLLRTRNNSHHYSTSGGTARYRSRGCHNAEKLNYPRVVQERCGHLLRHKAPDDQPLRHRPQDKAVQLHVRRLGK
jgi:hypothetical protein